MFTISGEEEEDSDLESYS